MKAFSDIGVFDVDGREGTAYLGNDAGPMNTYFDNAQDHLPMAYGIIRNFASPEEIAKLGEWFRTMAHPEIKKTEFNGDDVEGDVDTSGQPEVFQLYANPGPFKEKFPELFQRFLAGKDAFGSKVGLKMSELEDVNFPQDIRHVTYQKTDACPWHRDDPTNHFNTIVMCSKPKYDFDGGILQFYPADDPTDIDIQLGDAVIYSTPKVDHAVTEITRGVRSIFLVELKKTSLAAMS
eukprot:CFRG5301T1